MCNITDGVLGYISDFHVEIILISGMIQLGTGGLNESPVSISGCDALKNRGN